MVDRIRLILQAKQLSPTQFADAIGAARPVVSHILSGRNKPSLEVVQKILAAFPELSMAWLLNGVGPMEIQSRPAPTVAPAAAPPANDNARQRRVASGEGQAPVPRRYSPRPVAALPVEEPTRPIQPTQATPSQTIEAQIPAPAYAEAPAAPTYPSPPTPAVAAPMPLAVESSQPGAAASPVQAEADATANAILGSSEKAIRRIVIFYKDGSFADFRPE